MVLPTRGIPTWIVLEPSNDDVLDAPQPRRPERRRSNKSRRERSQHQRMGRDELIEEILDGRPSTSSYRRPSYGSKANPVSPPRQQDKHKKKEPPSPSSYGNHEILEIEKTCAASTTQDTEPLWMERTTEPRRPLKILQGKSIAPLLTCLSSKSSSDYEEQKTDAASILDDLNKDPRMELPLPDSLSFGVLAVEDASVGSVNGIYRCTGIVDSVGHYTKKGFYKKSAWQTKKAVTFSIFRCVHSDKTSRWYLSICSDRYPPGTRYDTDLYAAMATGTAEEVPPSIGWRVVVGSGIQGNPPMTLWIPHESRVQPCSVCWDRPVSHVLIPCGHACLCEECAKNIVRQKRPCPTAKCQVQSSMRLYRTVASKKSSSRRRPPPPPPERATTLLPKEPKVLPATPDGARRMVL